MRTCVYLAPQQIHGGHQRKQTQTQIYKQKWCNCQSKNFSGTNDTQRHLKTFRIISYEMFYFLSHVEDILVVWRCIQINFLIIF